MINSITKEIDASILSITIAEAVWKDVNERLSQGNGPRINVGVEKDNLWLANVHFDIMVIQVNLTNLNTGIDTDNGD